MEYNEEFNKEEWANAKKEERESAYKLIENMASDISVDGEKLRKYLNVQSRFNQYSVGNALLITAQYPGATMISDYEGWDSKDVKIFKKQKAFMILEPGDVYTREDGSTGINYNVKKVFDISQTSAMGTNLPPLKKDEKEILKALISKTPAEIVSVEEINNSDSGALFDKEKNVILVKQGMEPKEIFISVSKELAHAEMSKVQNGYNREPNDFRAFCISYILCKKNGIETDKYDFTALPTHFGNMDAKEVKAELTLIRNTANTIHDRMNKSLEKEVKEPAVER